MCACVTRSKPHHHNTQSRTTRSEKTRLQEITYLNLVVRHVLPTRFLSGTVYCFNMQHAKVNVSLKIYIYARFSPNSSWAEWGSQFLLETAFVPSWFAGSSWFRLGFCCLSPFFSLLFFFRKGVLFHDDLLVPLGSGWGSGACLPFSFFFLSSGKGFCFIMICWFLLLLAGVPVLVSLLPSFLRTGVLFHHDLLVLPGSGWGSGACLPSSLFFLSSGKGFCSMMICWFLLLPAGVPVLVSLLLPSFFPQERCSVSSWFAGSSWFWLGFRCFSPFFSLLWFRCLSPFISLLSFLRKEGLFHHDVLVLPGSGWGSGACLPSSPFFLSQERGLFHHDVLVLPGSGWGSGACLPSSPFFLSQERGLFHHDLLVPPVSGWGSGACLPSSPLFLSSGKGFCSMMICWFLLVLAGVPVLVSLLLSSLVPVLVSLLLSSFVFQKRGSVPSWFAGSSWFRLGFRCLSPFFSVPSSGKGFCSIMICWFLLVPAGVPVLVSLFFSSLVPVLVSLLLSSVFPQERGSVPWWFAGTSWFWLVVSLLLSSLVPVQCLSPFFSLLSFLRKGVLFHHDLLAPPGSGWGFGACLPSSLFFLSSRKGFCSMMICWFLLVLAGVPVLVSLLLSSLVPVLVSLLLSSFLGFCSIMIFWFFLVPAGVPVLVSLLLSSFFPQERGSVPSWCAGSSWFRLGFRCLSPFFSLLSFLTKGVLFHHDLLVPLDSGWGSGACLHSSLFFLSSRKGFCSIMICWFLLLPAGVPVLVSLLLSSLVPVLVSLLLPSFFPQDRGSVPSWFAGSSWFQLGFWCLSPSFSLLSFLRKGVLFHHDLLVPLAPGWGSGACLPSSLFFLSSGKGFCFIMICWFLLVLAGVPVLLSLLLSSLVPVLVSLHLSSFFPQERGSVPSWFAGSSWFRLGFGACLPSSPLFLSSGKGFCSMMICWFLLVLAGVPVLVSLLLSSLVPVLVSLLLSSFVFQKRGSVPSWFAGSSWFRLGFRCLSPFFSFPSSGKGFCSIMICWFLLVPAGVPVLVSLFFSSLVPVLVSLLLSSVFPQERGSVPWWFAGTSWFWLVVSLLLSSLVPVQCLSPFFSLLSFLRKGVLFHHDLLVPLAFGWGSGACLPSPFFLSSGQGFSSIMICWFFLVPAGVPVLVSLLLSSFFHQERGSVPWWFAGSSCSRLGFRCLSPFFSLLSFLRKGVLFHHDLLVPLGFGWGSGASLPSSLFFGSGACLPSSLFFLSSGKRVCSIMMCWFFLVPAGVPVLVSLLLPSFFLRKGVCSIMICWFLLFPAGVPVLVSLLLPCFFPQERGSVPWWFAGSSWFWLGFRCLSPFFSLLWFRCLSPFFSLLSFFRKEVLFHHDLLVLPGSGWGSGACLPSSLFLPQERGSVPSWFAGSSWFRLGFRCLSPFFSLLWFRCLYPFFSLLSFLRKGVLFHDDLLVPLGSGWLSPFFSPPWFRSSACLPSSPFFLSSGKGFCSIMICWLLRVPAGVSVLVSLLLSSFFPHERGSVPWWFAGSSWFWLGFRCLSPFFSPLWFRCLSPFFSRLSWASVPSWFSGSSWFRLGFRCLSPFFSLLSFLRKGVLFHHDVLVLPGSGWGSGACLPSSLFFLSSRKGFCSIMICWFLLIPAGVPVLVSILLSSFFPHERGSVPSWFAGSSCSRLGFRCLSPFFSLLWFRCLSPFFSLLSFLRTGVLFHHDLLVPPGSSWGSGACLPSSLFFLSSGKGFCSIMICWFLLLPAGVPVLVSLLLFSFFPQERGSVSSWFAGSSWFWLGFRCFSPFFSLLWFRCLSPFISLLSFLRKGGLFHHDLLVPLGSGWGSVLVSLLLPCFFPQERGSVPWWFAGSSWFWLGFRCLSPFFSLLWFRCLSPFFSLLSFFRKEVLFHHDLLVLPGSGWGSGACLPSSLFLPQERGSVPSWFAGSSWFRLGFRCLSPFFLFFGSGACIPSSLFCLSSGKGFCSMMICWYLLVLAGCLPSSLLLGSGPVLVSLLLPSFFPQERGSVPSWFAGSSGFRLGFRCLSPFFSLLSFLTKGVLFHDDLLVPLGSGWGSGACLPSSLLFGSGACLPSSLVFPGLLFHHDFLVLPGSGWGSGACLPSSLFFLSSGKGFCSIMMCWFFLVPAGVPVLVSLLLSSFFPHERGSVPSWFAGSSWFRLGFRCLSPFFSLLSFLTKGVLFHHDLLVPLAPGWGSGACLPSSLFFGSGACLPSSPFFLSSGQGFCSIMICWFLLVPAGVLVLVSLLLSSFFPQERGSVPSWFAGSSCSRLGFRCLSPFFSFLSFLRKGVLFHHDLLVPLGFGWGSGASLPSSLFFGSGACLPSSLFFLSSGKGVCSIMICWFLLVPAGVRCLSPFFSLLSFLRKWILFHHDLSNRQPDRSLHILIDLFHRSCVSLFGSHMGMCWRYCSQETTALVWKLRTSTLCGFLDASGRLFYCLVFVRLK